MRITSVVGARPNFMKIAPFCRAIDAHNAAVVAGERRGPAIEHTLVHTGQHYDVRMSATFFEQLNIPVPDISLEIGSGSHAEQVGNTMIAFERVLLDNPADLVVVIGDVNATLACSVTAKKLQVPVAHIEAGLRSGDMAMPEEINRLVTDRVADLLLAPDFISVANLEREGEHADSVAMVGNIMIDTLDDNLAAAASLDLAAVVGEAIVGELRDEPVPALSQDGYAVVTLHRPSNVDSPDTLGPLVDFIAGEVAREMPVVWPVHPRTLGRLEEFGLMARLASAPNVLLTQPLGYHELLRLNMGARVMLTDSGGLQEECCVLGTPCLTLRDTTERPVTLREHGGTCWLVGGDMDRIVAAYGEALRTSRSPHRPELWDGHTAERCVEAMLKFARP